MAGSIRQKRLSPPLMFAFRDAAEKREAIRKLSPGKTDQSAAT